jgi:hypothetical protein
VIRAAWGASATRSASGVAGAGAKACSWYGAPLLSCSPALISPEAKYVQRRFLDRYVKGERNGWEVASRVCLAVRRKRDAATIRHAAAWPVAVAPTAIFFDAAGGTMAAATGKVRPLQVSPLIGAKYAPNAPRP